MACGKGILESIMKVVIWCIGSPEKHFAEVIEDFDSLAECLVFKLNLVSLLSYVMR